MRFEVLRYLTDKTDGKPMQRSEIAGKDNQPARILFSTNFHLPNDAK